MSAAFLFLHSRIRLGVVLQTLHNLEIPFLSGRWLKGREEGGFLCRKPCLLGYIIDLLSLPPRGSSAAKATDAAEAVLLF